jgi:tetratricopeptide (TPR) repeat protein
LEALERYEEILRSSSASTGSSSTAGNDPSSSASAAALASSTQNHSSSSNTNPNSSQNNNTNPSGSSNNPTSATDPTNSLDAPLKSRLYKQLGWLHYRSNELLLKSSTTPSKTSVLVTPLRFEFKSVPLLPSEKQQHSSTTTKLEMNRKSLNKSLDLLLKAAELDLSSNAAWYCLGRAFTSKSQSREAFLSLKNSVLNADSCASTWCSIGVLYYQQRQLSDALHAFVCSLKAEPGHYESWLNLGILYEQDSQLEEALKCYKCAMRAKELLLINKNQSLSSSDQEAKLQGEFKIIEFTILMMGKWEIQIKIREIQRKSR